MTDAVRNRIFCPETLVPVGVVIAFLFPLVAGTWTAASTFHGINSRLESLENSIKSDRWSLSMEKDAWTEFKQLNPQIRIPDFRRIHAENSIQP